jgi:hypothetical protein
MVGDVIYAVHGSLLDPEGTQLVSSVLALLSVMAVIVALHLLQRERYGYEGALASVSAFVGGALILGAFIGFPSFGGDVLGVGLDILLLGMGMLVATVGIIALGIFTLDAGVLPWWCGAALIAGNPLVGVLLFFVGLDFLFGSWPVVVPWVVVGFAVFRTGTRQSQRPSRVR